VKKSVLFDDCAALREIKLMMIISGCYTWLDSLDPLQQLLHGWTTFFKYRLLACLWSGYLKIRRPSSTPTWILELQ